MYPSPQSWKPPAHLDAGLGLVVPHLHQAVVGTRHEVGAVAACAMRNKQSKGGSMLIGNWGSTAPGGEQCRTHSHRAIKTDI